MMLSRQQVRLARWATVGFLFTVLVALNGVFVRATGAGAGCGRSWPFCYDSLLPPTLTWHTVVEYGHRILSALAFALVAYTFWLARKAYSPRHPVRQSATAALALMITETLAGASLVIFDWVVHNLTWGRVVIMGVHLTITHALVAAVALTAWFAHRPQVTWKPLEPGMLRAFWVGFFLLWATAVLGAETALNEVVDHWQALGALPPEYEGPARFVRAIVWVHIVFGVTLTLYLTWVTRRWKDLAGPARMWKTVVVWGAWLQLALGAFNWWVVRMTATVQMAHLLLGYVLWIGWWYLFLERQTESGKAVAAGSAPKRTRVYGEVNP